jgi:putative addiction module killer protein
VKFSVREYLTADGRGPYREWLETLDLGVRARIQARVLRFEQGNLGDHKSVGRGVLEARLTFGPGYRIYFGRYGSALGGDKGSQVRNIQAAKRHWSDFVEATKDGKAK